jgi:hypothetical protein
VDHRYRDRTVRIQDRLEDSIDPFGVSDGANLKGRTYMARVDRNVNSAVMGIVVAVLMLGLFVAIRFGLA